MAKTVGNGNHDQPGETGVKKESDTGLAAGAHGKVCGVDVAVEGHSQRLDHDDLGSKAADGITGVVQLREQGGQPQEHHRKDGAGTDGQGGHFPERIP